MVPEPRIPNRGVRETSYEEVALVRSDTLTVEIAAPRDLVWRALTGDLGGRGSHVDVEREHAPGELRLTVRKPGGERQTLDYQLAALDATHTAVTVLVRSGGGLYALKRVLSFGRIDALYLDAVSIGLANLQRHLEEIDATEGTAGSAEL